MKLIVVGALGMFDDFGRPDGGFQRPGISLRQSALEDVDGSIDVGGRVEEVRR